MSSNSDFPTYEELFGQLDLEKGDDGRSVYSPAAYLVDLLQLLDDNFHSKSAQNLGQRRSDINKLPLNTENTYTSIPYLDIVNQILAERVENSGYEALRTTKYPFNLPFNLENERVKKIIKYLDITLEDLYKLFSTPADVAVIAKEYLKLSQEEYEFIVKEVIDTEALQKYWGGKLSFEDLKTVSVSTFLAITDLSHQELRELLYQKLSQTAKDANKSEERTQAYEFFINHQLGGYVELDQDEEALIWKKDAKGFNSSAANSSSNNNKEFDPIPKAWFERVNRFIRLAKKTEISFSDLDLILRSCCGNHLNDQALQIISIIDQIHNRHKIPTDIVCSLFSNINILGIGDNEEPEDLFNRIFNKKFAKLEKKYIYASNFAPQKYSGYIPLVCSSDLLSQDNKDYRKCLCRALNISEKELISIIDRFRAWAASDKTRVSLLNPDQEMGLAALSLLFRITKLSELLNVSSTELFDLLDILEKDPSIRSHHNFNVLLGYLTQEPECLTSEQDCYEILQGKKTSDLLWLIQILFAIANWMQLHDFTSKELKYLLMGQYSYETTEQANQEQKISQLNTLYQQFQPVLFGIDVLQFDTFDSRSVGIIHRILTEDGSPLVSAKDKRILKADRSSVEALAYKSLEQLDVITPSDFRNLGLGQKVLDKMFNHLIRYEYINIDGQLNETKLPLTLDKFHIETDFNEYKGQLFEFIQNLLADEVEYMSADDDSDDDLEAEFGKSISIAIYPSDLERFQDLTASERNELYENLIFNGYIDEQGNILQIDFFALEDNLDEFEVNTRIADITEDVINLIAAQTTRFQQENLTLSREIFAALPLKEFEIDNLFENLRFNGYLTEKNVIFSKTDLLNLNIENFNLEIAFYPHRHKILTAVKQLVENCRIQFYFFPKEAFAEIADKITAQWVYENIANQCLEAGSITPGQEIFFTESENQAQLILKPCFTTTDVEAVFDAIANIITIYQQYRFTTTILEELDFNDEEQEELIDTLRDQNLILAKGMIAENKLSYFLTIDNALTFKLDKFEDYNKDIFFALHAVAKKIDASLREISDQLNDLAENQEIVLFNALQDAFGTSADIIKVLCHHIFQTSDNIVEAFMVPVLSVVNSQGQVISEPHNNKFNFAYRRIQQFTSLVSKLGLSATETDIVFQDQNLVEKFPEQLTLPEIIDGIDALVESPEGVIYVFKDKEYWAYSAETYNLLNVESLAVMLKAAGYSESYVSQVTKNSNHRTKSHSVASWSDEFANLSKVDAAYVDRHDKLCIIVKNTLYCRDRGRERWIKQDRIWGQIENNFDAPARIDAAFQDKAGKTYLFVGDQYIRYSGSEYRQVDQGYPLKMAHNWQQENLNAQLPDQFNASIDAAFQGRDDQTYFFKGKRFVYSDSPTKERMVNEIWGKVRNNFKAGRSLDAAYIDGSRLFILLGDQVIAYSNSLENDQVTVEEGFPTRLTSHYQNLPAEFESGIDTAFKGTDGKLYLFKAGRFVSFAANNFANRPQDTKERWGIVRNQILDKGIINAAFVGLEGKTYLFSGDQYFRYSGDDYTQVDEGFPRTIEDDWGGLNQVDAAFILDGKTYLFGKVGIGSAEQVKYIRYSTHDYTQQDEGYPKVPNDNWWNLPFTLVAEGATFNRIDAVFTAKDGKTYLFSGYQFIYFDRQQRWWSEPAALNTYWDSIPFDSVNAAFTGKDGRTYIFSGEEYVRYSGDRYNKTDDRYPNITKRYWGNIVNNIAKTGKVDAALVVESSEMINEQKQDCTYTYLFSGNQYFRYRGNAYDVVDEGYPKQIATSLKQEPRFKNLSFACADGIDAAFADRRNLYLFKDTQWHVIADDLYKVYDNATLRFDQLTCAVIDAGNLYLEQNSQWSRCSSLEGQVVEKMEAMPAGLRSVPDNFQTGLNAVLKGIDHTTYLFKGSDCFNVSLNQAYPLAEEWGRVKNNIEINDSIDAAFVGRDGKTYLFSGDQYVVYPHHSDNDGKYVYRTIEGYPKPIAPDWGGLTSVTLAFVKDEKTYLFEKPDANGNARYVCYSKEDYVQPDPEFPRMAERDFWQIPASYTEEGFLEIDAVLFEGDNMFLFSQEQYVQFNAKENQWTYPKPLTRIWRNAPLDHEEFKRVKTAFNGRDGILYFFSDKHYVSYQNKRFSEPLPIKSFWGILRNNFVNSPGNKVDAAFVFQDRVTYLFSGDQYVRYSSQDYRYVDSGYPKLIVGNLRKELGFQNLPEAFEESIVDRIDTTDHTHTLINAIVSNHQNLYIFVGSQCHVVSQTSTRTYDIDALGNLKNNLAQDNKVDAAFVRGDHTFLFSGDQYVRYSGDRYEFVDDGYPKSIATQFTSEIGLSGAIAVPFQYGIDAVLQGIDDKVYFFKDQHYLSLNPASSASPPEVQWIKDTWGKIDNRFIQSTEDTAISAAFVSPDGCLYVFKGDQYIRYQDPDQAFVDEGFPKPIKDNWGNLPVGFEAGVDGGFVFTGRTYFLKQGEYVRYTDATYQVIDPIYPQKFRCRWGDWADYLLSDLKTIVQFKQLQDTYPNSNYTLVDFFDAANGSVVDPYKMLSEIFGWDIDEVKWLKRHNGFLSNENLFEVQFNLELVIKFFEVFAMADKMGTSPSELYEEVWCKLYPPTDLSAAANALYRFLGLLHS